MLKKRISRLEAASMKNRPETKIYFVRMDERADSLSIAKLNFCGTITEGRELMKRYPDDMFIVLKVPNKLDLRERRGDNLNA